MYVILFDKRLCENRHTQHCEISSSTFTNNVRKNIPNRILQRTPYKTKSSIFLVYPSFLNKILMVTQSNTFWIHVPMHPKFYPHQLSSSFVPPKNYCKLQSFFSVSYSKSHHMLTRISPKDALYVWVVCKLCAIKLYMSQAWDVTENPLTRMNIIDIL